MQWLKVSTAVSKIVGPVLDSAGAEYASAVIGDLSLSKNGGTLTALASPATLTYIANGYYTLALTTGNTDTLGSAEISCNKSTYQMPPREFMVLPATVYDALVTNATTAAGGLGDIQRMAGTALTARDIGASVLLSSGTGTGQLDFTSGVVKGNVTQWLGTAASTPTVAGVPNVNVKTWNDLATVALPLVPTTAGRTLDVSATGEAGVDWANVGSPTTAVDLSATTIATTQRVDVNTLKTKSLTVGSGVTLNPIVGNSTAAIAVNASGQVSVGDISASFGLTPARSGTAQAGGGTSITLDASASSVPDFYKDAAVYLTANTGAGQWRLVTAYNGTTKVATVAPAWATNPDNTTTFAVVQNSKVSGVTLADTLTTYTGDTPQTGDSYARIGAAGAGLTSLAPAATALSTAQWTNTRAGYLDNLSAAPPTAAVVAAAVWDLSTTGHTTGGTFGAAMNAAGSAGDPWATALPGGYTAGTAGYILGTNLDAAVSSRGTSTLTQTQVTGGAYALNSSSFAFNAGLDFSTTQKTSLNNATPASVTGAVGSVTGAVGSVAGGVGGDVAGKVLGGGAGTITAVGAWALDGSGDPLATAQGVLNSTDATADAIATLSTYVDTEVAAIKAKTDNLPASPASTTNITTVGAVSGAVGSVTGNVGGSVASVTAGVTVTTNNDKTGYALSATGLDAIAVTDPGAPANHTTLAKMIVALWRAVWKKETLTATQLKRYADDGTTANGTATVSDDGTTQTRGTFS